MFMWMTALLTFLIFPFLLIFGRPSQIAILKDLLPESMQAKHKCAKWTPVVVMIPHRWFMDFLMDRGVRGLTVVGAVFYTDLSLDDFERTEVHEATHVLQMSVLSPPLMGLVYILDVLTFLPFKYLFRWTHVTPSRVSVMETIAYRAGDARKNG